MPFITLEINMNNYFLAVEIDFMSYLFQSVNDMTEISSQYVTCGMNYLPFVFNSIGLWVIVLKVI